MAKFRKQPVVIEAYQWTGQALTTADPAWMIKAVMDGSVVRDDPLSTLAIKTLEGEMTASIGDWIIQGVEGEIYPCKPDIFAATYEPVTTNNGE